MVFPINSIVSGIANQSAVYMSANEYPFSISTANSYSIYIVLIIVNS